MQRWNQIVFVCFLANCVKINHIAAACKAIPPESKEVDVKCSKQSTRVQRNLVALDLEDADGGAAEDVVPNLLKFAKSGKWV